MNLIYFWVFLALFVIYTLIIISYRLGKLIETVDVNKNSDLEMLHRINKKISTFYTEMKCDNETHYKDLKAEFHLLREALKATEERKLSLSPVFPPPKKVMRGRLRLEEEVLPPPKAEPETSDTPT